MENRLLGHKEQCGLHLFIDLIHPLFNLTFWFLRSFEIVHFTLIRLHTSNDFVVVSEDKSLATIEKTEQEWLNSHWI
jgi:hypothetical protein